MSGSSAGERERFLVGHIAKALDDYERGDVGLGRLVADIDVGVNELFDVADGDWAEELRSTWGNLEIIYALVLHEGRSTLTDEERRDINATIAELRSLLEARGSS